MTKKIELTADDELLHSLDNLLNLLKISSEEAKLDLWSNILDIFKANNDVCINNVGLIVELFVRDLNSVDHLL